jgi:hypothetical protein
MARWWWLAGVGCTGESSSPVRGERVDDHPQLDDAVLIDGDTVEAALQWLEDEDWVLFEVDEAPTFVRAEIEGGVHVSFTTRRGDALASPGSPLVWLPEDGIYALRVTRDQVPPVFPEDGIAYSVVLTRPDPPAEVDSPEQPGITGDVAPVPVMADTEGDVDYVEMSIPAGLRSLSQMGPVVFETWSASVFLPDGTLYAHGDLGGFHVPILSDSVVVAVSGPAVGSWTGLAFPEVESMAEEEPNDDAETATPAHVGQRLRLYGALSETDVDCWVISRDGGEPPEQEPDLAGSELQQIDVTREELPPLLGRERTLTCFSTSQADCGVGCWYTWQPAAYHPPEEDYDQH